ncbi:alanine racemase [Peptoniphilus stercorisuis]|uniref:D-serine deaminase-like pyridoxal phosphate-dependent protein n=1 Tax=Peptoniphilus stercorisuis TaxID=1436965 RepID=A0ABS4K9S7_9FIRM|nr:alanine racemase [Peptoniphilus stercorisuis]MBP2024528.1 D-serine deaminase-like pyridoxal phosphate-dependent protein [Peptoniphilus stercorisuis]
MKLNELKTPSIILDLDILEKNLQKFHSLASENNKEIWPMIKTHKSSEILQMQKKFGSNGVLCGTLDECELAADVGFNNVMYAYPVSDIISIKRIIEISKKTNFILRIDDVKVAKIVNNIAKEKDIKINYTLIIDCGLHRFGVRKEDAIDTIKKINQYENLIFKGISTHPGHVYSATKNSEVQKYVEDEINTLKYVKNELDKENIIYEIISSGSTPTFLYAVESDVINIFHPGNYVYLDAIQMSLGIAKEEDCALRVLASIISNPRDGDYLLDAGAKSIGLDKGAHGNDSIIGHGKIIGHSEAVIESLSEEVGKVKAKDLKVSERIQIIPNHSCSTANLTSFIYGYRGENIEQIINVDIRGNSKK